MRKNNKLIMFLWFILLFRLSADENKPSERISAYHIALELVDYPISETLFRELFEIRESFTLVAERKIQKGAEGTGQPKGSNPNV